MANSAAAYLMIEVAADGPFEARLSAAVRPIVWRSAWMDGYYEWPDRPGEHGDFQPIFDAYTRAFSDRLVTAKRKFIDYDGNQALPIGTALSLELELDNRQVVKTSACVVRVQMPDWGRIGGLGVAFTAVDSATRQVLESFIEHSV